MKYFIAFAILAAVASARLVVPADLPEALEAEVKEIIAAINSPNTDPATAVLLEQMLLEILGLAKPDDPIHVDLPIVEGDHPIHIGPPIIDFPLPEGALTPTPVPSPAASSSPLVQIIVNVQGKYVSVVPQEVEEPPSSVVVVDEPPSEVVVVDEAPVDPVNVGPENLN